MLYYTVRFRYNPSRTVSPGRSPGYSLTPSRYAADRPDSPSSYFPGKTPSRHGSPIRKWRSDDSVRRPARWEIPQPSPKREITGLEHASREEGFFHRFSRMVFITRRKVSYLCMAKLMRATFRLYRFRSKLAVFRCSAFFNDLQDYTFVGVQTLEYDSLISASS